MNQKEIIENVAFSVGPLLALFSAKFGLKAWLRFETTAALVLSAVLIISPNLIFDHILHSSTSLKDYHLLLCSLYACYLIYGVLGVFFLLNSQDEAIFSGHLWSKIVANTLILVENIYSYKSSFHWNYKLLCSSGSFALFSMLISVYFYLTTKRPRSSNQFADRVNNIAKLESFIVLIAGLVMFAFPDLAMLGLKNSNETYRSLCRTSGILLFSFSFESFSISDFVYLKDKKTFMLTRLIGSLIELGVILAGQYYFKVFKMMPETALLISINMTYNLIVLYGYAITVTPKPSVATAPKSE